MRAEIRMAFLHQRPLEPQYCALSNQPAWYERTTVVSYRLEWSDHLLTAEAPDE